MNVKNKIRNMTDSQLINFLDLLNKEWLDDYFCRHVCPYRKGNGLCVHEEVTDCYIADDKTLLVWVLEQDCDTIIEILREYRKKSVYHTEV